MMNSFRGIMQLYAAYFQMALAAAGRKKFQFVFNDLINAKALPYGILGIVSVNNVGARPSKGFEGDKLYYTTHMTVEARAGVGSRDPMEPVDICHTLMSCQGAEELKQPIHDLSNGHFPGFLSMGPISLESSMLEDGETPLYEGRLDFSFNYNLSLALSKSFPCITEKGLPNVGLKLNSRRFFF